jgi:hypothetical protein
MSLAGLACACGGSNVVFRGGNDAGSDDDATSGSSSGGSSSSSGSSSGSGSGSGSGGGSGSGSGSGGEACGACATNAECEQTCPAPPSGSSYCCHVALGTCYVAPGVSCPSGSSSGGSGGSSGGGSGSGSGSSSGAMMCSTCATDAQCQLTCPPVSGGGINCCETTLGICYATAAGTCPLPQDASTE